MSALEVVVAHSVTDAPPLPFGPRSDGAVAPAALRDFLLARADRAQRPFPACLEDRDGDALLLTFDDGYRDFLTDALPVLEATDTPCLLFVVSDLLDGRGALFESALADLVAARDVLEVPGEGRREARDVESKRALYREIYLSLRNRGAAARADAVAALLEANAAPGPAQTSGEYLDWDELRRIDAHPLVEIGAHGRSHTLLTTLPAGLAQREIEDSRSALERQLGHPVASFAYPYGGHSFRLRRAVRAAGFRYAFTTRPERVTGRLRPYAIPRIDIRRAAEGAA